MTLRNRIAAALAVVAFASPALAADAPRDCTVCNDPTWPSLENLAPGIPLNQPPVADSTAIQGELSRAYAISKAPGVGVSAGSSGGAVYSDPTWPTLNQGPSGMAMTNPSPAQPAKSAPAKGAPAKAPTVAAR